MGNCLQGVPGDNEGNLVIGGAYRVHYEELLTEDLSVSSLVKGMKMENLSIADNNI